MCAGNTEEEAKGYRTKNIKELSAHRHCRLTAMIKSQLIVWQCAVRKVQTEDCEDLPNRSSGLETVSPAASLLPNSASGRAKPPVAPICAKTGAVLVL